MFIEQLRTQFHHLRHGSQFTDMVLLSLGLLVIAFIGREAGDFAISALTVMAVFSILADRTNAPSKEDGNILLAGACAILGTIVASTLLERSGVPLAVRCVPFFMLLTYWLYQYGAIAFKTFWRELLLLLVLAIPDRALMAPLVKPILIWTDMPSLSHATANIATGVTYILGLDVELDGTHIHAPNVIANVYQGCDGGRLIDFMVRLTIMLIVAFPVKRFKWPLILIISMFLGWLINVFRVSAMVFIANTGDMQAFEYWHTGEGSKIFHLIAIILFCSIGYFQITPATKKTTPRQDAKV